MDSNIIIEPAPAKINIALHVIGQRDDGYHLLEMAVLFTDFGDEITATLAERDELSISGRFASILHSANASGDNLIIKARDLLRHKACMLGQKAPNVQLHLTKNLPVASGIGGGSADAAATLRALIKLWNVEITQAELQEIALKLGADVPMCLTSKPLLARGIGEDIQPLVHMPQFHIVLVNPLKAVSTPVIFKALNSKYNSAMCIPTDSRDFDWLAYFKQLRNDLQPPAMLALSDIGIILDALDTSGALLARMSGSGATCYGIYSNENDAQTACLELRAKYPHWFIEATYSLASQKA